MAKDVGLELDPKMAKAVCGKLDDAGVAFRAEPCGAGYRVVVHGEIAECLTWLKRAFTAAEAQLGVA